MEAMFDFRRTKVQWLPNVTCDSGTPWKRYFDNTFTVDQTSLSLDG